MKYRILLQMVIIIIVVLTTKLLGKEINVSTRIALQQALKIVQPGDVVNLDVANYDNGLWIKKVNGTKDKPIIIQGINKYNLPIFAGGREAIHLVACNYITLRNIHVTGASGNGINADDAGTYDSPSKGLVMDNIVIENIGPQGNFDALKLSGVDGFVVRNCKFSGWGGSAIDMVGCHDGIIEMNEFTGKDGYSQNSGIQNKGGTTNIIIRYNSFNDAGARAINLGGSTGRQFFRPKLCDYEAKDIYVISNKFVGSVSPIAYVTSKDCFVQYNTIDYPKKWIFRILQEQPTNKFISCQRGVFENNTITFDNNVRVFFNIGGNTKPETFKVKNNTWNDADGNRKVGKKQ
jgi:hypothetical protein